MMKINISTYGTNQIIGNLYQLICCNTKTPNAPQKKVNAIKNNMVKLTQ